jgi:hypothetical protein
MKERKVAGVFIMLLSSFKPMPKLQMCPWDSCGLSLLFVFLFLKVDLNIV